MDDPARAFRLALWARFIPRVGIRSHAEAARLGRYNACSTCYKPRSGTPS